MNVVDVEVLFVDLQTEMESKSRVACLGRAFRRVLKVFLPEAYVDKNRGTIRCSPTRMHHRFVVLHDTPFTYKKLWTAESTNCPNLTPIRIQNTLRCY